MEMNPQRVRSAEFKTVRKGADPSEVRAFLGDVADELERAQNHSTAMEARARAAVARLQELGDGTSTAAPAATAEAQAPKVSASVDEAETISRTLLLAQRTADTTLAEARAEAARIVASANDEAAATRDSTREMAAQLIDEARVGARQAGEAERLRVQSEVDALKARRDFLESDVEHLELFLADQRSRLREAASALTDIVDRVPGGLGEVRAPLLSASDDDPADDEPTDPRSIEVPDALDDIDEPIARSAGAGDDERDHHGDDGGPEEIVLVADIADDPDGEPWNRDTTDDPTEAIPAVERPTGGDDSDGFRFTFDDDRR